MNGHSKYSFIILLLSLGAVASHAAQRETGPGTLRVGDGVVALWTSGPAGDQNPIALDSGQDFTMVDALGRILGEDVVRVANRMTRMYSEAPIRGFQKVV